MIALRYYAEYFLNVRPRILAVILTRIIKNYRCEFRMHGMIFSSRYAYLPKSDLIDFKEK